MQEDQTYSLTDQLEVTARKIGLEVANRRHHLVDCARQENQLASALGMLRLEDQDAADAVVRDLAEWNTYDTCMSCEQCHMDDKIVTALDLGVTDEMLLEIVRHADPHTAYTA